jgi:hypothetical protein
LFQAGTKYEIATDYRRIVRNLCAFADETLKWRRVQHTGSLQTLQVGDGPCKPLLPGMAFFPMDSQARPLYLARQMSLMGLGELTVT